MEMKQAHLLYRLSFLLSFHYSNNERKAILEDYEELFSVGAATCMSQNAAELLRAEQREYRSETGWLHVMGGNVFLWETIYFAAMLTALYSFHSNWLNWLDFFSAIPICGLLYMSALGLRVFVTQNYFDQNKAASRDKGWFIPAVISLVYGLVFYIYAALSSSVIYLGNYFDICTSSLTYASAIGAILCFFFGTYAQSERYIKMGLHFLYFILLTQLVLLNLHLIYEAGETYLRSFLLFFISGVLCTGLSLLADLKVQRQKPARP